jgi:hypothetical protein
MRIVSAVQPLLRSFLPRQAASILIAPMRHEANAASGRERRYGNFHLTRWARSKLLPFSIMVTQSQRTLHGRVANIPVFALHRPVAKSVFAGEVWVAEIIDRMVARSMAGDIVHAGAFFGDFLPVVAAAPAAAERKIGRSNQTRKATAGPPSRCLLVQISNIELTSAGLGRRQLAATWSPTHADNLSRGRSISSNVRAPRRQPIC